MSNKNRNIIILSIILVLALAIYFAANFANQSSASKAATPETSTTATPATDAPKTTEKTAAVVEVTVSSPKPDVAFSTEYLGVVKSNSEIEIFPQTSGQLTRIYKLAGSIVKKGDLLFQIGGSNGEAHPLEKQYQIALKSNSLTQKSLATAKQQVQVGEKSAALQLQSAQNQYSAVATDLAQIDNNLDNLAKTIRVNKSNFSESLQKNQRDLAKAREDIDDLNNQINELQDQKRDLTQQLDGLVDNFNSQDGDTKSQTSANLTQLQSQISALDATLEKLYSSMRTAKYGYSTALSGVQIGENQLRSQLDQFSTQAQNLELTKQSTITKLGYSDGTSDPLELSKAAYENTLLTLKNTLDQVSTQASISQTNLELAKLNLNNLEIRATADGVMGEISADVGDLIMPQTLLAQIVQPTNAELEIQVNSAIADLLQSGSPASFIFAGKEISTKVLRVSSALDAKTKLVSVVLALPQLNFRNGQTLTVKLPVQPATVADKTSEIFIPLDAVIIGTQESYVYIVENDQAKRQLIELGEINGSIATVKSGLTGEEQVIVKGAKEIIEGQKVKIVE